MKWLVRRILDLKTMNFVASRYLVITNNDYKINKLEVGSLNLACSYIYYLLRIMFIMVQKICRTNNGIYLVLC